MVSLKMLASMPWVLASVACIAGSPITSEAASSDLGIIAIGEAPANMELFVVSDCETQRRLADCSAMDAEGRNYSFFDGALSRVSAARESTAASVVLPAGVSFGEEIEAAARKVCSAFDVRLYRAKGNDGRAIYSSDFVIRSGVGVLYSIELVADDDGKLSEIVERTDF